MSNDALSETIAQIRDLLTWQDGWNTYNALAPNPVAVHHAESWITEVYQHITSQNMQWIEPLISGGGDGEVVFYWYHDVRSLTVYIEEQDIEYLQVHGKGLIAPMTDGEITTIDEMIGLWRWLLDTPKEQTS